MSKEQVVSLLGYPTYSVQTNWFYSQRKFNFNAYKKGRPLFFDSIDLALIFDDNSQVSYAVILGAAPKGVQDFTEAFVYGLAGREYLERHDIKYVNGAR